MSSRKKVFEVSCSVQRLAALQNPDGRVPLGEVRLVGFHQVLEIRDFPLHNRYLLVTADKQTGAKKQRSTLKEVNVLNLP